jgi:ankyrin repeat protein
MYAAQHWVYHAKFENVSPQVQKSMECLFDPGQPHFAVWVRAYNIDRLRIVLSSFRNFLAYRGGRDGATPLYHAALCGFDDLVQHLIVEKQQDVNAEGGLYVRPLLAALALQNFRTADLLCRLGADPNACGGRVVSPLHSAIYRGNLEMVQKLIEYGADINAQDEQGQSLIYDLVRPTPWEVDFAMVQFLLDRGVNVNAPTKAGSTPLHIAASCGPMTVVRTLLEHGANVDAKDDCGNTPLHYAKEKQRHDITELLLEYGAK